jgi:hypothetical protein
LFHFFFSVLDLNSGFTWTKQALYLFFFPSFFGVVLGFELNAYTLTHTKSPFFVCDGFFRDRLSQTICPGLALNHDPLGNWPPEELGLQV